MSKVITKTLTLKVESPKEGLFIYRVLNEDGSTLYVSNPTHRVYVAMAGHNESPDHRWGRVDLIGRGDSSYQWDGGLYEWVAVIPEISKLVNPRPRREEQEFVFETRKGLKTWRHYDKETARKQVHHYLRRYCGVYCHISSIKDAQTV